MQWRCVPLTFNHRCRPCPVILDIYSYLFRLKSFLKSLNSEKNTSGRWAWRRKMLTNSDVFSDQSEHESEKQTQTHFWSQQRSEAIRKWIMCIQCRRRSVLDHPRRGSFHLRMSPVSLLMCHSGNTLKHELTALHNQTCKKGENLSGLFQWSNIHFKLRLHYELDSLELLFPHPQPRKNAICKIPAEVGVLHVAQKNRCAANKSLVPVYLIII